MSSSEDNMNKYDTYIRLLLFFPDFALRHAMNAMFITYTKAQMAKQSSHFGETIVKRFNSAPFLMKFKIFRTLFEGWIFAGHVVVFRFEFATGFEVHLCLLHVGRYFWHGEFSQLSYLYPDYFGDYFHYIWGKIT